MGILDEDVARVREATDLVALAGEHIALKRVGRRVVGLCPFHTEKSPSFSINPENGCVVLLRLPEERRRDHVRPRGRASRLRRKRSSGSRRAPASRSATTTCRSPKERKRKQRLHDAVAGAIDVLPRAAARGAERGQRAPLPAQPRLRRRRRAPVLARILARRLRRAEPSPPERRSSRARTSSTPASRFVNRRRSSRTRSAAG